MKNYSITNFEMLGQYSEITVAKDGKPILLIINDGNGGADKIDRFKFNTPADIEKQFLNDAEIWGKENGNDFEPASAWLMEQLASLA